MYFGINHVDETSLEMENLSGGGNILTFTRID